MIGEGTGYDRLVNGNACAHRSVVRWEEQPC